MSEYTFDAFTRQAAGVASRRSSLLTLGGAALAAGLIGPATATAKKKGKKGGNREEKRCKKQVGQCREGLFDLCEVVFGEDTVEECVALFAPCCEFLKECNTAQAFDCAAEVAATIEP